MSGICICIIIIALAVFGIFYIIFGDRNQKSPCDKCNSENCCCCDKIDLFTVRTGQKPPPFVASVYLTRIEEASVEILSHRQSIDKIIVLWWGLDGLRLDEDGSLEWISREKKPKPEPVNQNVFQQQQQSIGIEQSRIPINYQNMCQSTRAQIDACKMQNATHNVNAQVVEQMQLPPLQTIYPYGYIPFPQYPYAQYYQGNLTGCCCDGTIMR